MLIINLPQFIIFKVKNQMKTFKAETDFSVLSKNKDGVAKLFRGVDADEVLESESADVVSINEA